MKYKKLLILSILALFGWQSGHAQLAACDPGVPFFFVDLSGNADSLWVSSSIKRSDQCCGSSNPDRCISFTLLLDSNAQGFKFDVCNGAKPSGALFYQVDCGTIYQVGDPLCLPGPGPYDITFCKPGSNLNQYCITSIAKPEASPPKVVADGCSALIFAKNYVESTITWTSIPFNATHNSYLDCLAGCDTVLVQIDSADSPPDSIVYQVTGQPAGGCSGDTVSLPITVYFVDEKFVEILPKDPVICFGGITASVTANPNGGAPPYEYLWSTGETTQSINVGVGTYWVRMTDSTDCPPKYDTVTVTANPSPISANAGPDLISCQNNTPIQLQGSVVIATGGQWSGGGGAYNPNDTTLDAIYTPSAAELTAGFATLTLSTTGNGICPVEQDQVTITYPPAPIVDAGGPYNSCSNNAQVVLSGTVTNAGSGRWSGGAGSYSPNDSSLNATYTPTAAEITAGTVNLTLTSIQNGNCTPVTDNTSITIGPGPIVSAGANQTVCGNNADVTLNGSVSNATGGQWSGGSGSFNPSNTDLNAVYTPSAAEISAGSVTLTLTSTGNGNCLAESASMTITITPAPVVDAGLDQTVCANNNQVNLNGTVTVATGGTWSGGGGNFNPDANTLNAIYTPSTGEITAGFVDLILTSTGNGTCIPVTDTMRINITPAPTVFAGNDGLVCSNNPTIALNGSVAIASGGIWSNVGGAFNPSNTTLNANYTPTAAEITAGTVSLILTSTGNGTCLAEDDTVTYTIAPSPTAFAGNDQIVCANNPDVTLNASITIATGASWSGGGGSFNPNSNTLNATYTPSAAEISAGTVTLSLTTTGNGSCAAAVDDIVITITPGPSVNAGTDLITCSTAPDANLAGIVNVATGGAWSGGGGTFNPSNTDLNAIYTPSAAEITAGSAQLILTSTGNGTCVPVSDTVQITIVPGPVANAGGDQFQCKNNVAISLNGSVTNATGGQWLALGSFLPNSTTLNATYIPTAGELASSISAIILETTGNGVCPADRDTALIIFTPEPIANAGNDVTVCENNNIASISGTTTNATVSVWSGGAGTYTPNNTSLNIDYTPTAAEISNGFVDLILSANRATCNAVTDTMRVIITPSPVVSAGVDQTVCANNAATSLNGSVTGGATGGIWSTSGTGTFTPSNTALNATYNPSNADTLAGIVTLTLTSTGNGNCNPVAEDMQITITDAPTADAGSPISICANNASTVLNGSVTIASGGTWTGGTGTFTPNRNVLNPTYIPSAAEISAGSVVLTLNTTGNGTCLPATDNVTITITPAPTALAGNDVTVCADNPSVNLNGVVTIASGGQWTGGGGVFSPNANDLNAIYTPTATEISNGTVTLTLVTTGNGNCNAVSDPMTITITAPPTVSAGSDQDVCGDLSPVTLNGAIVRANGGTWTTTGTGTFNPSADSLNASYQPTVADTSAGSVTLTLTTTGNFGCNSRSDDVVINFITAPSVNAGPDDTVCTTELPIQLAGGGSLSNWSSAGTGTFNPGTGALNATYQPTPAEISAGNVTLTLTTIANAFCPSISDDVTITIPQGPIVNAGNDTTVCGINTNITLSGQVSNAAGGTWSTLGSGTFNNANNLNAVYTYSSTDKNNGTVSLVLTSTGNSVCDPVIDTIVISILDDIVSMAGPDLVACADASGVALVGSVTGASGGIWSTSGSGTFTPNNTTLNASYIPSNADTTAGNVTLTLTTTGNGGCPADVDDLLLTLTPAPTVNAGNDITICADAPTVPINGNVTVASGGTWTSTGTGVFSPSASNLSTNYIPSDADTAAGIVLLILETTGNGTCNPVRDSLLITILPVPQVDAGSDQSVCADNLNVNLNGTVLHAGGGTWTSSGTGTFSPNANDLNASYNLSTADSTAGLIVLTLTSTGNGTCNPVQDQMIINVTPAPTVDAGNDLNVCASNNAIALNGNVTVATGGIWSSSGTGTFNPSNTDLNAVYVPSTADTSAGNILLTLTSTGNGTCNPVSDAINVNFTAVPNVDAGNDTTVCSDIALFQLNATFSNATGIVWSSNGSGSFSPSTTDPNATYSPSVGDSSTGAVVITLTSTGTGACPAATANKNLTLTPGVTVFAGADFTVCADTAGIPLNGAVVNAAGGVWGTTGTGTFVPDSATLNATYIPSSFDTAAGSVSFTLLSTGNGGCIARNDAVTVSILPAPTVFAGPDRSICSSTGTLNLNGQIAHAGGGIWTTPGSGSFSPSTTSLVADYVIHPNDTTAGFVDILLTSTSNGLCKAVTDTFRATFDPQIIVDAGPDSSICVDQAGIGLNGNIINAPGGTWSTSGTGTFSPDANTLNALYIPTAADKTNGSVTLTLTSLSTSSCVNVSDDITLTLTPAPTVFAGLDDTVCKTNPTINLGGNVTIATGGIWSTASGQGTFSPNNTNLNATFTPSASQLSTGSVIITLTTTGNGTCNSRNDQFTLTLQNLPQINAGPDQIVCADNPSININGSVTNAGGGTWTSAGTGSFVQAADSLINQYAYSNQDRLNGTVNLFLTSTGNNACPADRDTVILTITPAPTITATAPASCTDETGITLNAIVTISSGLQWSSSGTGTFTPNITSNTIVYTPSAADITAGSATIYVTSTGNGNCTAIVDSSIILSINQSPTVNAGVDKVICADQTTVQLNGNITNTASAVWTSSGGGSFTPNASTLNAQYVTTALDRSTGLVKLYLTTNDPSICNQKADSLVLTITPAPTVDAGNNQTICANEDTVNVSAIVTIATGVNWTSTGSGTFNTISSIAAQYFPSLADKSNGSVYLIATSTGNGLCNPVKDSLLVTITPAPTIDAGPDVAVCSNFDSVFFSRSITVATGAVWSSNGSGSIVTAPNANPIIYAMSASDKLNGLVTLFATSTGNGSCLPVIDTVNLIVGPEPLANIILPNACTADDSIALIADTSNVFTFYWQTDGTGVFTPDTTSENVFYLRSSADSLAGSASIFLTGIGDTACSFAQDTVILNLSPPPSADAGTPQTVCADTSGIQLNGIINDALGGVWSSTGTGTFNPNNTDLNAIYVPSQADTAAGTVSLVLTTSGNGACPASIDTVEITITPAPTVDAGPAIVCSNNPITNINGQITVATGGIWTSSGDGTFGDSLALSTNYTVGPNDIINGTVVLTLTSTGNGDCNIYSDNLTLNVANAPEAIAGNDTTICGDRISIQLNASIINAGGGLWTSPGSGNFDNNTSLNAIYTFDSADIANDSVILILETTGNGTCLPDYDSIIVFFSPIPTVDAGPGNVCSNNATLNISGSVTIASGGFWDNPGSTGTFGNANNLNTTYTPSATDISNGSVILVLTTTGNGGCNAYDDTVNLFITPGPTSDAGLAQNVCADTSFIQLNGLVDGAAGGGAWTSNGGGTFSPDTSTLNAQYIPDSTDTASGSVTIFLTTTNNGNCLAVIDSTLITIAPEPIISASADQVVCADTAGIDVSVSIANAGGVSWTSTGTGTFSGGNTSLSPTYIPSSSDTANGFVQLVVEATGIGNCKPKRDTIDVTITPAPTLNPGGTPFCFANSLVALNASVTVASGIQWTTSGTGTFVPNDQSPNASYLRSVADSIAGSVQINAVTIGNGSCKAVRDSIVISLIPPPTVNAGSDIQICDAQTIVPIAGTFDDAGGILWSTNGSGNFDNATDTSTNYNVDPQDIIDSVITIYITTTGNGSCLPAIDSIELSIVSPSPVALAGNDLTVCADAPSVQLNGSVIAANGGTWTSSGSGFFAPNSNTLNAQYFPSAADTTAGSVSMILQTTGIGICNADFDTLLITFTDLPTIDAGPPITLCEDAAIANLSGQDGGNAIFWSTSGSGIFNDSTFANATYTATIPDIQDSIITLTLSTTGAGGCQVVTDQTTLTFSPAPIVDPGFPQTICADEPSANLQGTVTNAGGGIWTSSGTGNFGNDTLLNTTYAPSNADTTAGFVYLILSSRNENTGCGLRADSVLLTISDGVSINAGGDQLVCRNAQSLNLSGTVTTATGGVWSTNGGGFFAPAANGLNTSYFFTTGDRLNFDTIEFYFTSTGNGSCLARTDTALAIFVPNPVADAGNNQTVCADAPNVNLNGSVTVTGKGIWFSSGSGIFVPNDSALNVTYQPSAADIANGGVNISLTSRDNGDCNPATDFVSITILPAPIIDAGADQLLCFADASIILNGTINNISRLYWTSSGDGFFADSTVLNPQYIFSSNDKTNGAVTLFINSNDTNQCNQISDSVVISFRPEPMISAGVPQTVCADLTSINLTGSFSGAASAIWTSSGLGNFAPSPNDSIATYFFDSTDYSTGTVGLTFTTDNSVCPSVSDAINITITPAPTIDVGADQNVCASEDSVILNATVTVASGAFWTSSGSGTFVPASNIINTVYVPSAADVIAGTVAISAITTGNGTCSPVTDQLILTFRPDPVADAGPNVLVCADAVGVPLNGSILNAGGGFWSSSGSGTFSPDPTSLTPTYIPSPGDTAAGNVTLTLSSTGNQGCPLASDDLIVGLQPVPIVSTGNVDACADQTGILLNGQVANSPGVQWSTSGSGIFTPNSSVLNPLYVPSAADFIAAQVTLTISSSGSGACAERSDDATIIITPLPVADAGTDQVICRNSITTLVPFIEPGNSYEWYSLNNSLIGQSGLQDVFVSTDTSFILRVIDINGCDQFDTVNVNVVDPPVFNLAEQFCFSSGLILNSNALSYPGFGTYQWFRFDSLLDGQINDSVQITQDGTFIIQYNFESCNISDTSIVTPLPVLEGPDVYVCQDDSAIISTNYYPLAQYQWFEDGLQVGQDTNITNGFADDSTFFQVRVTDSLGCINRDTILLVPVPPPILILEDNPACVGDIVTLNARPINIIDTLLSTYTWFRDGTLLADDTLETLRVNDEGEYTVIYALGSCTTTGSSEVTLNLPPVTDNVSTVEYCSEIDETFTLDAGPGTRYFWFDSEDTTQTTEIDDFGYFAFVVYNEFDCFIEDSILVTENCPPQLFIPNAFSPNGDNIDDFFRLFGRNFKNLNFKIFNRWGEVIFFASDKDQAWDGTYRGEGMPVGVYPWTAEYEGTFPGQEGPFKLQGSVTLIR
ncbi:MAG: gliding motility-associated C-terminal domain-containing protein [Cytophagales bacterium]